KSSITPRLLRLRLRKTVLLSPCCDEPQPRARSPAGGSTLITSAPASPNAIAQYGPATPSASSTTRKPSSGPATLRLPHRGRRLRSPLKLVQYLAGMLAGHRRAAPARRRAREVPRRPAGPHFAPGRGFDFEQVLVLDRLLVVTQRVEAQRIAARHVCAGEAHHPVELRLCAEQRRQQRSPLVAAPHALGVCGDPRVFSQLRPLDRGAERPPFLLA